MFYGVFVKYLNTLHTQTIQLVAKQLDADQLTPISDQYLHSISIANLFEHCSTSYQFLVSTGIEDPTFYSQFAEVISLFHFLRILININY